MALTAQAQPTISQVSGALKDGSTITIDGAGFGANGPQVWLYDDFEGGAPGEFIDLAATVGAWTDVAVDREPIYDTDAHSGATSMRGIDSRQDGASPNTPIRQFRVNFPEVTEILFSYWIKVPSGFTFPGSTAEETFPAGSTFKIAWIFDGQNAVGDDDICMPTHINGKFVLGGNDGGPGQGEWMGDMGWGWNVWQRVTVWMRADPQNLEGNSQFEFQVFRDGAGVVFYRFDDNQKLFPGNNLPHRWTWLNLAGWAGNGDTGWWQTSRVLFDDVYFAIGSNARARVEVCNTPTYDACTQSTYLTPTNWSDSQLAVGVRAGVFGDLNGAYLYVTKADGTVNSTGFALGSMGDQTAPMAPMQLRVN